jgi:hypothetical protein
MSEDTLAAQTISEKDKEVLFGQVKVGMEVIDRLGQKVGKVDDLFSGAGDREPTAQGESHPQDDPLGQAGDMPPVVRGRLLHDGFIRIDAGFLKHHRYALWSQIDRVENEDRVSLLAVADDLIKS